MQMKFKNNKINLEFAIISINDEFPEGMPKDISNIHLL